MRRDFLIGSEYDLNSGEVSWYHAYLSLYIYWRMGGRVSSPQGGIHFIIGEHSVVEHYGDIILATMTSQITSLTIVNSAVYSGAGQSKHQSSASLAFVQGIHRWP